MILRCLFYMLLNNSCLICLFQPIRVLLLYLSTCTLTPLLNSFPGIKWLEGRVKIVSFHYGWKMVIASHFVSHFVSLSLFPFFIQ